MFGKKNSVITTDTLDKLFDNKKEQRISNVKIQEKVIVPPVKKETPEPIKQIPVEKVIEKIFPNRAEKEKEVEANVSFKRRAGNMIWL